MSAPQKPIQPSPAAYGAMIARMAMLMEIVEDEGRGNPGDPALAVCLDCTPVLPMPFGGASMLEAVIGRDDWVATHRASTGHRVVRPEFLSHDLNEIADKRRGMDG